MRLTELLDELCALIGSMETREAVEAINEVKARLHQVSPQTDPVDVVRWVPADRIHANSYNPNKVAPPEMELLHVSIREDGYTQPIVCYACGDGTYEVVDGFHRWRVGREKADIRERVHGYLPIVVIDKPLDQRMASTVRHNRARGKHQVDLMGSLVRELIHQGWGDEQIAEHLGMSVEELLRLKQIVGAARLLAADEYSASYGRDDEPNEPDLPSE